MNSHSSDLQQPLAICTLITILNQILRLSFPSAQLWQSAKPAEFTSRREWDTGVWALSRVRLLMLTNVILCVVFL